MQVAAEQESVKIVTGLGKHHTQPWAKVLIMLHVCSNKNLYVACILLSLSNSSAY